MKNRKMLRTKFLGAHNTEGLCNKESGKGEVGGVAIKQQWKEENCKSKVPRKLEIFEEGAIGCVK